MAKRRDGFGDSTEEIRDEEREVETRAAFAGKGMGDDSEGDGKMPGVQRDESQSMCQRAADEARSYNEGGAGHEGTGTEVY